LKNANLEILRLKGSSKEGESSNQQPLKAQRDENDLHNYRIYVGNVNPKLNNEELIRFFQKYGTIEKVFTLKKHLTSKNCIIEFSDKNMAKAALSVRAHYINNRKIFVEKCKSRFSREAQQNIERDSKHNQKIMKAPKVTSSRIRYYPY
jgi:RNA recognition motif-containing protein